MSDEPIFEHDLRKPIGKDGEITKLTFREPRAGDIMRYGNPVKNHPYSEQMDISFDEVKMSKMLAALSGIQLPFFEKMHPNDWMDCAWGVARFFLAGLSRT